MRESRENLGKTSRKLRDNFGGIFGEHSRVADETVAKSNAEQLRTSLRADVGDDFMKDTRIHVVANSVLKNAFRHTYMDNLP